MSGSLLDSFSGDPVLQTFEKKKKMRAASQISCYNTTQTAKQQSRNAVSKATMYDLQSEQKSFLEK